MKADAYGHGGRGGPPIEATRAADVLGWPPSPKASRLRQAGIGLPILAPPWPGARGVEALAHDLQLVVVDEASCDEAAAAAAGVGRQAVVHLKVDYRDAPDRLRTGGRGGARDADRRHPGGCGWPG
ncbi:MAG: alanine racemase [Rubrivivax sp.]|nr:alanine racemase [Rubrivivax sp.]